MTLKVLDLFSGTKPNRDRSAGNACDLAAHDMLDKGSKPSRVLCFCLNATLRCGGVLVGEQCLVRDVRRTIGRREARQEIVGRSELDCRLARAFQPPARSTPSFFRALQRRIWIGYRVRFGLNMDLSSASDWHQLGSSVEKQNRTVGNAAHSGRPPFAAAIALFACNPHSTTSPWRGQVEIASHKTRSVSKAWS